MRPDCVCNDRLYFAIAFSEYNGAMYDHHLDHMFVESSEKRAKKHMKKVFGDDWRKHTELYKISKEL